MRVPCGCRDYDMQCSCPCIYIYIQRDGIRSRREMAARESLTSQWRHREPGRQPPGVLHISRDPWGRLEGTLGLSQDNRAAPFDHCKVPVQFSVDNGIQNRAETVRLPPGSPTVHLWAFYGLLRVVYVLSAVVRSRENAGENWEQLAQHTGARTTSKNSPGALENRREPYGTTRKWPKLLFLLAVWGP